MQRTFCATFSASLSQISSLAGVDAIAAVAVNKMLGVCDMFGTKSRQIAATGTNIISDERYYGIIFIPPAILKHASSLFDWHLLYTCNRISTAVVSKLTQGLDHETRSANEVWPTKRLEL
jgi:hypothetical protein